MQAIILIYLNVYGVHVARSSLSLYIDSLKTKWIEVALAANELE